MMRRLLRSSSAAACLALTAACAEDPIAECRGVCSNDNPLYAVSAMVFEGEVTKGVSSGFDLDGVVGPSRADCVANDFTAPDGTPGIDNQLARLLPLLMQAIGEAFPTLIQNAINDGGLSMLFEVVPPPEGETLPVLAFHRAKGTPLLDSAGSLLSGQTFDMRDDPPFAICHGATVEDRRIRCGPFKLPLAIVVFGVLYQLDFQQAVVEITFDESGESAEIAVGGSLKLSDIFNITDNIEDGPKNLPSLIHSVLPPLADTIGVASDECDEMSGAASLKARVAFAKPADD